MMTLKTDAGPPKGAPPKKTPGTPPKTSAAKAKKTAQAASTKPAPAEKASPPSPKAGSKKKPPAKASPKNTKDTKAPVKGAPAAKASAKSAKPAAKGSAKTKSEAKTKEKKKPKGKWAHDLRLGLDMRFSIVDQQTAHVRLRSTYTRPNWNTLFDWSYAYGKSDQRVTSDRMNGSAKTDLTFEPGWYVYGSGGSGYDLTRRIELRTEFGAGAGYHLFKGKRFLFDGSRLSMDLETGGEYQDKKATTGQSTQKYFWRLGNQLTWDPIDDLRVTERLNFYPRIGEQVSHRYRLEVNLAYKIIKNMALNLTLQAEAEPESIREFAPDDIQIRSSLGWKF